MQENTTHLTFVTPGVQIVQGQRELVSSLLAVFLHVPLHIAAAQHLETRQTDPVLARRAARQAGRIAVQRWEWGWQAKRCNVWAIPFQLHGATFIHGAEQNA